MLPGVVGFFPLAAFSHFMPGDEVAKCLVGEHVLIVARLWYSDAAAAMVSALRNA